MLTRILEALGNSAAAAPAPLFGYDVLEALADLLRRVVWADAGDGEDAHAERAAPELAVLLAGKLGATVNDARLEIGRRLVQVLGHATAHGDPDTVAALQRAQLLQTALGTYAAGDGAGDGAGGGGRGSGWRAGQWAVD